MLIRFYHLKNTRECLVTPYYYWSCKVISAALSEWFYVKDLIEDKLLWSGIILVSFSPVSSTTEKKCNKKLYVKWYEPLMLRGIECDLTIIVSDNSLAY